MLQAFLDYPIPTVTLCPESLMQHYSPKMPTTPLFLLSGKNDNLTAIAQEIVAVVKEVLY